jgi:hypothetical protein
MPSSRGSGRLLSADGNASATPLQEARAETSFVRALPVPGLDCNPVAAHHRCMRPRTGAFSSKVLAYSPSGSLPWPQMDKKRPERPLSRGRRFPGEHDVLCMSVRGLDCHVGRARSGRPLGSVPARAGAAAPLHERLPGRLPSPPACKALQAFAPQ